MEELLKKFIYAITQSMTYLHKEVLVASLQPKEILEMVLESSKLEIYGKLKSILFYFIDLFIF